MKNGSDSSAGRLFSRYERLLRSRILGFPFVLVNAFTKWEIYGRENFLSAIKEAKNSGRGMITFSNHLSLFDDPLVIMALLRLRNFTVETKFWWSTACASNFNPSGKGFFPRFVRYFSDVSNMVFLSRAKKRGSVPPEVLDDPLEYISSVLGTRKMEILQERVQEKGMSVDEWLRSIYTPASDGYRGSTAPLNQIGMIEVISRINAGEFVHLFPEGGRSRDGKLGPARAGAGKVIYHCGNAILVPIYFYGTQDVLPVGSFVPRLFKKVIVSVGQPVPLEFFDEYRRQKPSPEIFNLISNSAMTLVAKLRPLVLERYYGKEKASTILIEETQLRAAIEKAEKSDLKKHVLTPVIVNEKEDYTAIQ